MAAQRFSDEVFRLPFTIGIGGLDEVDAAIDRLAEDAFGGRKIQTWAEVVGAQADD